MRAWGSHVGCQVGSCHGTEAQQGDRSFRENGPKPRSTVSCAVGHLEETGRLKHEEFRPHQTPRNGNENTDPARTRGSDAKTPASTSPHRRVAPQGNRASKPTGRTAERTQRRKPTGVTGRSGSPRRSFPFRCKAERHRGRERTPRRAASASSARTRAVAEGDFHFSCFSDEPVFYKKSLHIFFY